MHTDEAVIRRRYLCIPPPHADYLYILVRDSSYVRSTLLHFLLRPQILPKGRVNWSDYHSRTLGNFYSSMNGESGWENDKVLIKNSVTVNLLVFVATVCMGASPKCSITMLPCYTLNVRALGLVVKMGKTTWAMALGLWDCTGAHLLSLDRKLEIIIIPAFFCGRICSSLHLSISFFIRPRPLLQDCTGRVLLHLPSPPVPPMRSVYSSP